MPHLALKGFIPHKVSYDTLIDGPGTLRDVFHHLGLRLKVLKPFWIQSPWNHAAPFYSPDISCIVPGTLPPFIILPLRFLGSTHSPGPNAAGPPRRTPANFSIILCGPSCPVVGLPLLDRGPDS